VTEVERPRKADVTRRPIASSQTLAEYEACWMRSDFETIVVSRHEDQILLVTLNRPEVSNALNMRMGLDLTEL
jgi:1,4-dihydroxy-2-naphthoyl-CoA synthase